MKAVILAGGYGTRISEESEIRPKPMIEIGGNPILWHIMKIYSAYNINDFVICLGYKGEKIREFFTDYDSKSWNIELVDTGLDTMTGGRLKKIQKLEKSNLWQQLLCSFFCVHFQLSISFSVSHALASPQRAHLRL